MQSFEATQQHLHDVSFVLVWNVASFLSSEYNKIEKKIKIVFVSIIAFKFIYFSALFQVLIKCWRW